MQATVEWLDQLPRTGLVYDGFEKAAMIEASGVCALDWGKIVRLVLQLRSVWASEWSGGRPGGASCAWLRTNTHKQPQEAREVLKGILQCTQLQQAGAAAACS
jgi:hypothetical protein